MAPRVIPKAQVPKIIADWRTGRFSQGQLADKYGVSKGFVHNNVKGVVQDTAEIVDGIVKSKRALAVLDEIAVNAVNDAVHESTKYLNYFAGQTIKNCNIMMDKIGAETSIGEHALAQRTLKDGRETVMGKEQPSQNVQVNTGITVMISERDARL